MKHIVRQILEDVQNKAPQDATEFQLAKLCKDVAATHMKQKDIIICSGHTDASEDTQSKRYMATLKSIVLAQPLKIADPARNAAVLDFFDRLGSLAKLVADLYIKINDRVNARTTRGASHHQWIPADSVTADVFLYDVNASKRKCAAINLPPVFFREYHRVRCWLAQDSGMDAIDLTKTWDGVIGDDIIERAIRECRESPDAGHHAPSKGDKTEAEREALIDRSMVPTVKDMHDQHNFHLQLMSVLDEFSDLCFRMVSYSDDDGPGLVMSIDGFRSFLIHFVHMETSASPGVDKLALHRPLGYAYWARLILKYVLQIADEGADDDEAQRQRMKSREHSRRAFANTAKEYMLSLVASKVSLIFKEEIKGSAAEVYRQRLSQLEQSEQYKTLHRQRNLPRMQLLVEHEAHTAIEETLGIKLAHVLDVGGGKGSKSKSEPRCEVRGSSNQRMLEVMLGFNHNSLSLGTTRLNKSSRWIKKSEKEDNCINLLQGDFAPIFFGNEHGQRHLMYIQRVFTNLPGNSQRFIVSYGTAFLMEKMLLCDNREQLSELLAQEVRPSDCFELHKDLKQQLDRLYEKVGSWYQSSNACTVSDFSEKLDAVIRDARLAVDWIDDSKRLAQLLRGKFADARERFEGSSDGHYQNQSIWQSAIEELAQETQESKHETGYTERHLKARLLDSKGEREIWNEQHKMYLNSTARGREVMVTSALEALTTLSEHLANSDPSAVIYPRGKIIETFQRVFKLVTESSLRANDGIESKFPTSFAPIESRVEVEVTTHRMWVSNLVQVPCNFVDNMLQRIDYAFKWAMQWACDTTNDSYNCVPRSWCIRENLAVSAILAWINISYKTGTLLCTHSQGEFERAFEDPGCLMAVMGGGVHDRRIAMNPAIVNLNNPEHDTATCVGAAMLETHWHTLCLFSAISGVLLDASIDVVIDPSPLFDLEVYALYLFNDDTFVHKNKNLGEFEAWFDALSKCTRCYYPESSNFTLFDLKTRHRLVTLAIILPESYLDCGKGKRQNVGVIGAGDNAIRKEFKDAAPMDEDISECNYFQSFYRHFTKVDRANYTRLVSTRRTRDDDPMDTDTPLEAPDEGSSGEDGKEHEQVQKRKKKKRRHNPKDGIFFAMFSRT